jgi:hypothetical protein
MKKFAMLIALAVASVASSQAQNLGVKAGYNFASLSGKTVEASNVKATSGFYAGMFLNLPIGDVLALQPELLYSRQGAKWEYSLLNKQYEQRIQMDYLNIPVMAQVNLGPLTLQAGPQFGFLVGKPQISYHSGNNTASSAVDKSAYASFDFGVGAGLAIHLTNHLFVEARYTHSLTNAFDKNNTSLRNAAISRDNDFKNSVLSLGLGVSF